ncbi:MAG: hypothetical protein S0880_13120 [Actinomycetota bacterium]|nr:hypothetical protein [Actinomycetota bacterium]
MAIEQMFSRWATRRRYTAAKNVAGGRTRELAGTVRFRCRLEQRTVTNAEISAGAVSESTGWVLFCGPAVDLAADDEVVVDDVAYLVAGAPHVVDTPRGPHHIEARLTRS